MGHWNGDRNCEPDQLTEVSARGGTSCRRNPSTEPRFGCQPLPGIGTRKRRRRRADPPLPAAGRDDSLFSAVPNMRNNSAPPKFSKLWTDVPQPSDRIGAYTTEQLEQMNQQFTAAVERAFRSGDESEMAAAATYDLRRR
jgi:hypothetical protein